MTPNAPSLAVGGLCKTRWLAAGLTAFAILAGRRNAAAQVNAEPFRQKLKANGWSATVQASLDARTGNTEGVDGSAAGGIGFSIGRHLGYLFGNAEVARWNDVVSVANSFIHARYNYEILSRLWGEGFLQLQTDQFQRILLRDLIGFGPRAALYQSKSFNVFLGTGWMLEHDAIDVLPMSTDRADYYQQRWNNYLSFVYVLDTRVLLTNALYVQPRWNDFTDARTLDEAAVVFKITTVLSASITSDFHYDSQPPAGVLPSDLEIKNVLSLTY